MNLKDSSHLTNWKRFDRQGEITLGSIEENDSLLIKGDNLDVLKTLLPTYKNKIKLLYNSID